MVTKGTAISNRDLASERDLANETVADAIGNRDSFLWRITRLIKSTLPASISP
jgi:hypothetical protein